jgi:uncharacterized membrane protein
MNFILGHEGHTLSLSWIERIGGLHFLFLHFPIALIMMALFAEVIFFWRRKSFYNDLSRCMLFSSVLFTLPTALFGYIYSYTGVYQDLSAYFLKWHMWSGIATALLTISIVYILERKGRNKYYYINFVALLLALFTTGYCGGCMTFEVYRI